MVKVVLFALGITAIITMGIMIDAQSSPPAVRPVNQAKEVRIFALGRVEGITSEIELRSQLDGRIVELPIKEGQFVEQGAVLLVLDDQQYVYGVALATAEVELARANLAYLVNGAHPQERAEAIALYRAKLGKLDLAKRAWNRVRELYRDKVVSQQQADDREGEVVILTAEVDAAKARMEQIMADARLDEVRMEQARIQAAEARLELARVQLQRTRIHAPSRGRILEVDVELGELTGPKSDQPAIVMVDTTKLQVRAFVDELDAPRVKLGMAATVETDGLPDRKFKGRVVRLSSRMGRKQLWSDHPAERYDTKTREVWIELDEAESLVVGLRVDVMIDPDSPAPPQTGGP
jgi:multidrug resistance efflux pump